MGRHVTRPAGGRGVEPQSWPNVAPMQLLGDPHRDKLGHNGAVTPAGRLRSRVEWRGTLARPVHSKSADGNVQPSEAQGHPSAGLYVRGDGGRPWERRAKRASPASLRRWVGGIGVGHVRASSSRREPSRYTTVHAAPKGPPIYLTRSWGKLPASMPIGRAYVPSQPSPDRKSVV